MIFDGLCMCFAKPTPNFWSSPSFPSQFQLTRFTATTETNKEHDSRLGKTIGLIDDSHYLGELLIASTAGI